MTVLHEVDETGRLLRTKFTKHFWHREFSWVGEGEGVFYGSVGIYGPDNDHIASRLVQLDFEGAIDVLPEEPNLGSVMHLARGSDTFLVSTVLERRKYQLSRFRIGDEPTDI